jgi:diketogulonate reductase-like aldo/keto reductase
MIGFGTKTNTTKEIIQKAIDYGYFFIDTKDTNESISYFKYLHFEREKMFFCSKLVGESCYTNHEPKNVYNECIKSLQFAGLSYWDLYYMHTTHSFNNINVLETYEAMITLKKQQKIKNIGLSNITYEQLESIMINTVKPDYIQIEIHPYLVESRIVELCKVNNIKIVSHSPLGNTLWNDISKEEVLIQLSLKYNKTITQIVLKWHLEREIIPIPSSNNIEHIKSNLDLDFKLLQEDIICITNLNKGKRVFIKPNHYESIGPFTSPPKKKNINILDKENNILQEINKKGFFIGNVCNIHNNEILNICKNIENEINMNNNNIEYHRPHEITFISENLNNYKNELMNHSFFKELVNGFFEITYTSRCFIKKSFPLPNLTPCETGLYHRDRQSKSLKIVIYLNDVSKTNGSLNIVYPEIPNSDEKMIWYKDKINKRTSEEQILRYYSLENILSIEGEKYTMIIFEGNILHSGGYVKKGYRKIVYMEFFTL